MNNTIILTDEQMKALQSGQSITIEPPKQVITKWEPKHRDFNILDNKALANTTLAGFWYDNTTKAEQAAKAIRSYARQLSWISENNDGWIADWKNCDQLKYYVAQTRKNICIEMRFTSYHETGGKTLGTIYMSKDNAEKLCQLLNDGIVEF